MKLQILINHYSESPELIGRLLQSIGEQTGVDAKSDYSVMIASDGNEHALDRASFDGFPFNVQYSVLTHKGTRATRNALLDAATADYVMFCDADDCFKGTDGVSTLLNAANDGADIISVPFEAETKDGDGYRYVRVPNNTIWTHGKIFRRQYLTENHIRFDEVANHGEMSFLWLAFHLTKNIRFLRDSFYIWKWNDQSVTRADPFFNVRTYDRMLLSYSRLAENLIERKRKDLYDDLTASVISTAYVDSRPGHWDNVPQKHVEAAKSGIMEYVRRYGSDYNALDEGFRRRKYNSALVAKRTYGPPAGFKGIGAWMETLTDE